MGLHGIKSTGAVHLCRCCPSGVKLVQMPAQAGDDPGPIGDEIFAVINQQPQLSLHTVERATGRSASRSAALATARASIGSDLP